MTTIEDTPKEINLSATDANGDSLFYTLVDNPSNGVVRISGDGKATYTPNSDFFGSDSFTFKVNDGMDDSSTASITIEVTSNDIDNDGVLNVDASQAISSVTGDFAIAGDLTVGGGNIFVDRSITDDEASADIRIRKHDSNGIAQNGDVGAVRFYGSTNGTDYSQMAVL